MSKSYNAQTLLVKREDLAQDALQIEVQRAKANHPASMPSMEVPISIENYSLSLINEGKQETVWSETVWWRKGISWIPLRILDAELYQGRIFLAIDRGMGGPFCLTLEKKANTQSWEVTSKTPIEFRPRLQLRNASFLTEPNKNLRMVLRWTPYNAMIMELFTKRESIWEWDKTWKIVQDVESPRPFSIKAEMEAAREAHLVQENEMRREMAVQGKTPEEIEDRMEKMGRPRKPLPQKIDSTQPKPDAKAEDEKTASKAATK